MYTSEMRRAVHSLAHYSPKNFYLDIVDEDHFITVIAPEKVFMALRDNETKLTEEQHKLVNYLLAQGMISERNRVHDLLKEHDSDTINVEDFIKLLNGE